MRKAMLAFVCVTVAAGAVVAGDGVGWRTDGSGRYPQAQPPTKWSPTENIVWKTPLGGPSTSSPIVVGDRIFVGSDPADLVCVSAADGKILWRKTNTLEEALTSEQAAEAKELAPKAEAVKHQQAENRKATNEVGKQLKDAPQDAALKAKLAELRKLDGELNKQLAPLLRYTKAPTHNELGYSAPTPVSDGKNVWVLTGLGTAACYDMEGNRKWIKFVDRWSGGYGHSASPVLIGGVLLVHINEAVGLDGQTGKELWRAPAPSAWGTPLHVRIGGTDLAVTAKGTAIRASDGAVLASGLSGLTYASPITDGAAVYFVENRGKALKLPETLEEKPAFTPLWTAGIKADRYYSTAAVADGLIYACTMQSVFSVVEAATGKLVYEKTLEELPKTAHGVYPSVTLAGKYVYVSHKDGTTLVLEAGREFKPVAVNKMEPFRSNPVFVGKRMYVRGLSQLFCIGE